MGNHYVKRCVNGELLRERVREWGIVMSEGALIRNRYIKGCVNGES
jgi:hypothetical protein